MNEPKKPGVPKAFHAKTTDGSSHAIGFFEIKVLILNDDGTWFAQGLDIDFAAQGSSLDDVKLRFREGLWHTIEAHLEVYGAIDNILQPAPKEYWTKFYRGGTVLIYSSAAEVRLVESKNPFMLRLQYHQPSDDSSIEELAGAL